MQLTYTDKSSKEEMMATKVKKLKTYGLVGKKPLARFYYKGRHSHPVRRTVLIIEETDTLLTGYEVREGSIQRTPEEALKYVRSYRKDRIVRWGDYSRLRMSSKTFFKRPNRTTLERFPIVSLFLDGA